MSPLSLIFAVGAGGCLGTLMRLAISEIVRRTAPESTWFVATMIVNLVGCLAVGVLGSLAARGDVLPHLWARFLINGLLGGFTTFSAFGYETVTLMQQDRMFAALGHAAVNILAGLLLVWCGMKLADSLCPVLTDIAG
jgi:CrcB protein